MKLSIVHLKSRPFEFDNNISEIIRSYKETANDKPHIILYPELAISGFFMITNKELLTDENMHYNDSCLIELEKLVKEYTIPLCIGAVVNGQSVYVLINEVGQRIIHKRNAHLGTKEIGVMQIDNLNMCTLICDETMHINMVDAALDNKPDIILHPSAFGEPLPCVDYPLQCSKLNEEKLSNTLFITINITDTDMHGARSYGRTSILRGNTVLYSISSNKTQIIFYDTKLDYAQTRQLNNAN